MKQLFLFCFLLLAGPMTAEAQFTNSGSLKLFSGAAVTFFGNVTNNGTIIDSGSVVTLAGSATQTIAGSSVTTFRNLTLNNSSVVGINLGQAMNVRGTLVFTDGYLNTTATNILTLTNNSLVSGVSNNSFVSGPVRKTGNQAFVFPVGKNVVYAPIAIAAPGLATDQFTAEYFQTSPHALYNTTSKEVTLNHVSQCEYWILDRTTGTSNVTVNLSWDSRSCGVTTMSNLRVARWDGSQWTDKGNGGTTGSTTAGTVVTASAVTAFSPFTLASFSSDNPLPVELAYFTAECENNQAVLRWSTMSELNNDFFTIESSKDALEWTVTDLVNGVGSSTSQINYAYTDLSNPGRDQYYRLKQTDFDGTSTYHDIRYLESCNAASENEVSIYPNPAESVVNILSSEAISAIAVFNPEGKQVNATEFSLTDKKIDFSQLPAGIYFIHVTTSDTISIRKVVIRH